VNFGPAEMLVVGALALLIFGPQRLPEIARTIGKAMREFKRATSDLTDEIKAGLDSEPTAPKPSATKDPTQELRPGPRE